MSNTMHVAFLGASTGVGLAALKQTLAAGHQCIALCRNPGRLTAALPLKSNPNLRVVQGNAHDVHAVSQCLQTGAGGFVDKVVTTIGAKLKGLGVDDPHVCEKGMRTLLAALAQLRRAGVAGSPRIVACSTTYTSRFGRDVPVLMLPIYALFVATPARDKRAMEKLLVASGEPFTLVRPSHLTDGESSRKIRVGTEDPNKGREVECIGYTISREDAGRWVAENLVLANGERWTNKIAVVTY